MKILYAASNSYGARLQLSRWLQAMQGSGHHIKIAAYKKSSPQELSIDWTLDALLNIYQPDQFLVRNDNLAIYHQQIKDYAPDLIISDLEYFTSYIASDLNITLWQCSSCVLRYALTIKEKHNTGLYKYHAFTLSNDIARTINIMDNSNANFVYSHYIDTDHPPLLQANYEWIRPYHQIGKVHRPCAHSIVAGLSTNNAQVLDILRRFSPDAIVFMEARTEKYENLQIKDIESLDEYYCNLQNSEHFVCQGQSSFLADAFYNGKFSLIYPNYEDVESLINSHLSKKLKLGRIMSPLEKIKNTSIVQPYYRNNIKYLHEKIEEIA